MATETKAPAETKPSARKTRNENQSPTAAAPPPAPAPSSTPPVSASTGSSEHGKVLQQVMPVVSPSARATITGTLKVRVRVAVDPSGNVGNATFVTAGPSKYFSRQAMQAAQQWKFAPAQSNGQPAASAWILQFGFRRSGTEVQSEPAQH